ncbi:transcription-repair coupling factor [Vagococcus jeotgali]|uniref:transcription-repair coupling factor n=1 Tax=Vagococcus jeotgali TaxID=3109030 RepID=UPI00351D76CD
MYLNQGLVKRVNQDKSVISWLEKLDTDKSQLITGLSGSAKSIVMATTLQRGHKTIIVTPNLYYANKVIDDLQKIVEEDYLHFFPVDEVAAVELSFSSPEAIADRIDSLMFLSNKEPGVLVLPLAGFRRFLPSPKLWQDSLLSLETGETIEVAKLPEKLVFLGYQREQKIGKPGEFSIRGSIIDIYPLTNEYPVRIDLFDDEIDSIRLFDVETQRSKDTVKGIVIPPATDQILTQSELSTGSEIIDIKLTDIINGMSPGEEKDHLQAYRDYTISQWQAGERTDDLPQYMDLFYQDKHFITDYLSERDILLIDDYSRMMESERELLREEGEWLTGKLVENQILADLTLGGDFRQILKKAPQHKTYFSLFQKGMGNLKFQSIHPFEYRGMQQFFGQLPLLKVEITRWIKQGATVLILVEDEHRTRKIESLFIDEGIPVVVNDTNTLITGRTQIQVGSLESGFELPSDGLVVILEKEILHTKSKRKARKQTISNAERLKSYNELSPGDYVVHENHGIGKYIGMETLLSGGVHQDYMTILYQNNDKLFIPVTQLDLIQKYVASESKTPRINKLGGSEWTKTKQKVSAKVEDIADDLIQLYAEREAEKGYAFSVDDDYQQEFEDSFPYSETDDQLRSIQELKKDMEKDRPMDRLLVGDVGYGKTEVAIRAAFKAVRDGKQVAFLVPTTILAQQHYETMVDRFKNFPVNVGVLSRFRTKKQQEETLEGLKKGQIDIVVGTHRILSKDVVFMDLGLLIIDEEQRFGVKHKERLKQLRSQVDVLTLTATPIPRTLHMSMLGVRDLSVIETPPANRYPVQTYVMEKNPGAIREASEREIARGGQIFYLHNRVDTIEQKVDELKALIPDARVSYAHGQMTEVQLENVLLEFINGEYDILVTTTIIETGVDIPNVNTLFVENADHMGLSQLYQLRGRVGRSNRIAYAYFMYEPMKVLNEVSEKRLQAIKDFTELGSGFKIAMRDLSIRGAGNLLGAQQHGFIDSVGFDMYTHMLTEAVKRKQGIKQQDAKTVAEIDLGIDAYIPVDYIEDERQKIEIYKRIRQIETQEMHDEIDEDLIDRFGEYPDEVANLLTVGLIKANADYALVEKIHCVQDKLIIDLSKQGQSTYTMEQIFRALSATNLKASINTDDGLSVVLTVPKQMNVGTWLHEVSEFIFSLRQERYTKLTKEETPHE